MKAHGKGGESIHLKHILGMTFGVRRGSQEAGQGGISEAIASWQQTVGPDLSARYASGGGGGGTCPWAIPIGQP